MFFIQEYKFGKIKINDIIYTSDLIIYPEKIDSSWWRKEGHRLSIEDIKEVIKQKPEVLIIGTGMSGVMNVPEDLIKFLNEHGIETVVQTTDRAVKKYNEISQIKKVIACLHLTC